ncbi:MAG: Wzz/FepE/Etk N-terminal domain-containing protein, partial [Desulfotignum sp.]
MQEPAGESLFQEREIHLSEYLMVLMKRRTLIILVFILTVLATAFYSFSVAPVFESTAKLIIDKETSNSPITGERTDYESFHSQTMTFNTSIKMITSTPVITQTIQALNLDAQDKDLEISFIKKWLSQLKTNITQLLPAGETGETLTPEELENQEMQALIKIIQEKISVEQIRDTRL